MKCWSITGERILSSQSWIEAAQSAMLLAAVPLIYFGEKFTILPLAKLGDQKLKDQHGNKESILLKEQKTIKTKGNNFIFNMIAKLQSLPLLRKPQDIDVLTKDNKKLNRDSLSSNRLIFGLGTFILNPLIIFASKLTINNLTNILGKLNKSK